MPSLLKPHRHPLHCRVAPGWHGHEQANRAPPPVVDDIAPGNAHDPNQASG
jgi:hypothetical protein